MEQNELITWLELKGVKPTANRLLVLKALKGVVQAYESARLGKSAGNDGQVQYIPRTDLVPGARYRAMLSKTDVVF